MMTAKIPTERVFSISCFEGLRLVRQYRAMQPSLDDAELLNLIVKLDPNGDSLDLEAAIYLDKIVHHEAPMDGLAFYQACIKVVVVQHQPLWSKAMRAGRMRFLDALEGDDHDVFRAAGLAEDPPSIDVVNWWDDVSGHARLAIDNTKMEQARQAEALTIEYEKKRLAKLGISEEPKWFGLDDNYAGYDVLSYDASPFGTINRLIEVKSTTASPLRFFLTRNEWKQAEQSEKSYHIHAWDMTKDPPYLHEITVAEVMPHVPTDNGKGQWTTVGIPIKVKNAVGGGS